MVKFSVYLNRRVFVMNIGFGGRAERQLLDILLFYTRETISVSYFCIAEH